MHHAFVRRSLLLLTPFALQAMAAPVDITLVPTADDQLEVRLRPTLEFDGIVSNIQFTIRWDAASDAHLGTLGQSAPAQLYIPMVRSNGEQEVDGHRYQIYVGFGMLSMEEIPTQWMAGQEYTLMTIPVEGVGTFTIINDTWSSENNGEFYASLNGQDETGNIYNAQATGVAIGQDDHTHLGVWPNPTEKECTLTISSKKPTTLDLDLLNAAGQVVWTRHLEGVAGTRREVLDLGAFDKGVYLLRASGTEGVMTRRVVKK